MSRLGNFENVLPPSED